MAFFDALFLVSGLGFCSGVPTRLMANRNLPEVWEVEWEDSSGLHGWCKDEEARAHETDWATTIGFVVAQDRRQVTLSPTVIHLKESDFDRRSRFDCPVAIPRSAIRKVRQIRKARP